MDEYVNKQELLDLLEKKIKADNERGMAVVDSDFIDLVNDTAVINDVAEVVRCKECQRCYKKRTKRKKQLMHFCMRMDGNEYQVNANDFCSYGERKPQREG